MNRVRLAFCVLVFCGSSVAGLARQDQATPVVTAASPVERVRFAASSSAVQLRIEVRSPGGAIVYDSDWKDGNILDWLPQDTSGQPLAYGVYRLVMRSKNLAGQTSETQASLHVDSGGMGVDNEPSTTPKITLTAHDGETGELITTTGDLSFRFGDFLNRKDTEAMRLTADGKLGIGTDKPQAPLDVNGLIRTTSGIEFPDGTILTTAAGLPGSQDGSRNANRNKMSAASATATREPLVRIPAPAANPQRLIPKPSATPDYQFKIQTDGVHIGTTNAFGLSVAGNAVLGSNLSLASTTPGGAAGVVLMGGTSFIHAYPVPENLFVGTSAGNFSMTGTGNTGIGKLALASVTTGSQNVAVGLWSLVRNDAGSGNTAVGSYALNSNQGGGNNTASGAFALGGNGSGGSNTAVGVSSLRSNTSGSGSVAIGLNALYTAAGADYNTAVGNNALYSTTGSGNIALGDYAGYSLTTGTNNIDIGNYGVAGESGMIRIGTTGTHTAAFVAGIYGATTSKPAVAVMIDSTGQLATTNSSRRYKFDINSMDSSTTDGLMRLRPVTFRYIAQGDNAPIQYGLIAEEVAEVYPEMVTRNEDGEVETVLYQFLAPMLLNEVQEQHRQIEEQQAENKMLGQRTTILETENAALRQQLDLVMQRVEKLERRHSASE